MLSNQCGFCMLTLRINKGVKIQLVPSIKCAIFAVMRIIRGLKSLQRPLEKTVVTIGNFDGVHRGHRHLIEELKRLKATHGQTVVMTFDPHPVQVLHPEKELIKLFDARDQEEQLEALGVDVMVIEPFTQKFAQMSANQFLSDCLFKYFLPKHVVVGYDFVFGKDREGNFQVLQTEARHLGIQVDRVEPFKIGGEVVSSRGIRAMVTQGDLLKANEWLGRTFYVRGVVESGAGRGRKIGFPTLNLQVRTTLPPRGVYVTRTEVEGRKFLSVTNIGVSPTFLTDGVLKVETHLLDTDLNAYGKIAKIEFVERLRDEIKFSMVDELIKQITDDVRQARNILRGHA